jgi:putative DNA primase/helicase
VTPRPQAPEVNVAGVPAAMRAERRWLVWRYELRDARWTKVPRGKTTDPSTWATFERALSIYRRGSWDGIGFVLGDGWGGMDGDHCRNPATGVMDPRMAPLLEAMAGSYIEVSPSLDGVKAFFRAARIGFQVDYSKDPPVTTAWNGARYFAVTGLGAGDPTTTRDAVVNVWAPESAVPAAAPGGGWPGAAEASDDDLLIRIASSPKGDKFLRLWRGETVGYASHSEADLALCAILAFWTNYDTARVDRLFRLSDLMRPKWNYPSYRRSVLGRACIRRIA